MAAIALLITLGLIITVLVITYTVWRAGGDVEEATKLARERLSRLLSGTSKSRTKKRMENRRVQRQ